jgi:hypothetical protein
MVAIPPFDSTVTRIYDWYASEEKKSPPRPHLGASIIGRECERQIWYSFRWVQPSQFQPRILRLFKTGHLEETRLVGDLAAIGAQIQAFDLKTGRQFSFKDFGGHFSGSLDGICLGLIEAPKTWHLTEFKTHNDNSFKKLVKAGVAEAKPEHYAQMQVYMGASHAQSEYPILKRALYLAVNKNDDQIYAERIEYDESAYLRFREKARRIIFANKPLVRISEKPDAFCCKFCDFQKMCHGKKLGQFVKPEKNCRTCTHSTPKEDGTWFCEKWNKILGQQEQREGCDKHLYLPQLLPFELVDVTDDSVVYDKGNGETVCNYEGGEIK